VFPEKAHATRVNSLDEEEPIPPPPPFGIELFLITVDLTVVAPRKKIPPPKPRFPSTLLSATVEDTMVKAAMARLT